MRLFKHLLLLVVLAASAWAQEGVSVTMTVPEPPSIQRIQESRDALGESQEAARTLYDEAIARLERAAVSIEAAARFRAELAAAPQMLESIREQLRTPPKAPEIIVPADATLRHIEQREAEAIAALTAARQQEAQLQTENNRRQDRRNEIQSALPTKREELAQVEAALQNAPQETGEPQLVDAQRAALLAQRYELAARIDEIQIERASYDARRDLLPARRDLASRRVEEGQQLVAAWSRLVSARRQAEADATLSQATDSTQQAAKLHPVLQAYAEENQRLAETRTQEDGIPVKISKATRAATEVRSTFSGLRQQYNAVQQRIQASGLDRATGLMLRREFESLPNLVTLRRLAAETERDLEQVEYELFERRDQRTGSDDINRVTEELLSRIQQSGQDLSAPRIDIIALEQTAMNLAAARRDILAELESDADRYQDVLVELGQETDRLIEAAVAYEAFIRERILWVRSISNQSLARVLSPDALFGWIGDSNDWHEAIERTRQSLGEKLTSSLAGFASVIALFAVGIWGRRRLAAVTDQVRSYRTDGFGYTVQAVVLTIAASLPLPIALWWVSLVLSSPVGQVPVALALSEGLQTAAVLLFPLGFLRLVLRPGGLGDAHFRWPVAATRLIRRHLHWFIPVVVPTGGLVSMVVATGDEEGMASLGRIAFTVAMGASAMFVSRVMHPSGELVQELIGRTPGGWAERLRFAWFPFLVGVPISFAALAWLGFFYTVLQLEVRLINTAILVVLLVLVNGMLLRWLFLARRRVAVEDAKRRREQAIAAAAEGRSPGEAAPMAEGVSTIDEDKLNLPGISLQTRQLFRTAIWLSAVVGLYVIWADVLPALRMLDRVELYPTPRIVESLDANTIPVLEAAQSATVSADSGTRTTAAPNGSAGNGGASNGASGTASSIVPIPGLGTVEETPEATSPTVTLANIGLAFVVLIATIIVFRNLPGLIEIMVLQRLPLDAGSRYALSTVLKYIIAIIGITAAFATINLSWSNIQWLAAALTFGLAFGLQEIFANFISGLIILAERPIRIGDTVTVGNVSGTVSRIRMRATTITDWDRKELVIPNKTFITGDVINWTLSDPMLRLIVPVGISYGADVHKAEALLLEAAAQTENVLEDPKAFVVFSKLGESTLDFELRVFIPHVDHIIRVRHALNMAIIESFRKANIEIAFPQRDLHVRSIGDLRELIATPRGDTPRAGQTQHDV